MNKKPGLLFSVCFFAVVLLAAAFHMEILGKSGVKLPEGINPDSVLYVCPTANRTFDMLSAFMHRSRKFLYIAFGFGVIVLLFSWGWALYQNLVKDKFVKDAYKNSWGLTKFFFWVTVLFTVLMVNPNKLRSVTVRHKGHDSAWVLCENTSENAKAVKANAVKFRN